MKHIASAFLSLGVAWLVSLASTSCGTSHERGSEPIARASVTGGGDAAETQQRTRPGEARSSPELTLPAPRQTGGRPLMEALALRRTNRRLATEKRLPLQTLSNLLWAATGINRPESGKRTAPTAVNCQEIDVFVALEEGLYLYEPLPHRLKHLSDEDLRRHTGRQLLVSSAPVDLIYVADLARMEDMNDEERRFYAATDTGFISQNVYLFCASEGLATVVIGSLDRARLGERLHLGRDQRVILSQAVGYPR